MKEKHMLKGVFAKNERGIGLLISTNVAPIKL